MANPVKRKKGAGGLQAARKAKAKHPWAAARISVDRQTVIIEFLPGSGAKGRIKFTRDDLTSFIKFLGNARREMPTPLLPEDNFTDMEKSHADIFHARWYVDLANDLSGSRLAFDHPAFGHVRFLFPRDDAAKLADRLMFHLSKMGEAAKVKENK